MIIKLRSERKGDHVHERVFMGVDNDHLKLTGALIMDVGEWQVFGVALMLGAEQMKDGLIVLNPDDRNI